MSDRQESLDRVCEFRGLPSLKVGDRCEVDGRRGVILGGNTSSNLSVVYDDEMLIMNCPPYVKMRIFNAHGGVCYESDDLYTDPCENCGVVERIESQVEHVCRE